MKTEHKNRDVCHKKFDDAARVTSKVQEHVGSLPESFNTQMYKYPVWRENKKSKWMSLKGFDTFSGSPANHVRLHSSGTGMSESHANAVSERSAW